MPSSSDEKLKKIFLIMIEYFNLPILNKLTSIKSDFSSLSEKIFQSIWLLQNRDKDICKYHEDFANSGWFSPRKLVWVVTRELRRDYNLQVKLEKWLKQSQKTIRWGVATDVK